MATASLMFVPPYRPVSHVSWVLVCGLLFAMSNYRDFAPVLLPSALLFMGLSALAVFDARFFIIPDTYLLALGGVGLATIDYGDCSLAVDHIAAAAAGFLMVRGTDFFYAAIRGKSGLGRGDAKLFALAGLWLGLTGLPTVVLWASLSGLIAVVVMKLEHHSLAPDTALPFGPHLAAAIWLVWLFGPLTI